MITATNNAAPKDEKPNLDTPTKLDVICKIAALTTKLNNPSVKNVKGSVRKTKIGRKNAFRTDKITLARNAVNKL